MGAELDGSPPFACSCALACLTGLGTGLGAGLLLAVPTLSAGLPP